MNPWTKANEIACGRGWLLLMRCAVLLAAALPAIALLAPTETTMGDAQRIVYIHVPVAWLGLLGSRHEMRLQRARPFV